MWWCRYQQQILGHARVLLTSHYRPQCHPFSFRYSGVPKKRGKLAPLQERKMVDRIRLWAKGGEGGNGCCSYRHSRTARYGQPDGGNGGRGGDVILECSPSVWDFSNLQHHLNAQRGGHGTSKNKLGSRGFDKVAQVPVGTVIHLVSGEIPVADDSSTTPLDPWDIPVDVNQANSIHQKNQQVNLSHSAGVETLHGSPLNSEDDVNKSVHANKESLDLSPLTEINSNVHHKGDGPCCKVDYMDISDKEAKDDKHDEANEISKISMEADEGSMDEEDDDLMDEEDEVVVQYSVAELTQPGQRVIVAQGGEGGLGNVSLMKDSKSFRNTSDQNGVMNQGTLVKATLPTAGRPGSESLLILELKSIADVGLIGMPNAGKSTLLGALSMAKPAVGDYAFTTLRPNIGNLNFESYFSVKVADIPGIIKGAHANRGLGHAFLRHIERTKVLVYVVDLAAALDGRKGIPPWEQLRDLVLELEYYQQDLSSRPSLVVANKIDEVGAENVLKELQRRVQGVPIFPVCAVLQEGVPELKCGIRRLIDGCELHRLTLDNILVD